MKRLKVIALIVTSLIVLLSSTNVFAGYQEEQDTKIVMYDSLIHLTNSNALDNTDGKNYQKVSSMNELKNQFRDNSIILIENNMKESLDLKWLKEILKENNIIVLFGYENLITESAKKETTVNFNDFSREYINKTEKMNKFLNEGYYKVILEDDNLVYGKFLVKTKNLERLLEYVNVNEGKKEITNRTNEKLTTIEETIESRTATNHLIRFYWADNKVHNKIYSEPIDSESYHRIHLYKGEIIYELGGSYEYSYSDAYNAYTCTFTKVHGLNENSQYITGYMVVDRSCEHLYETDGWFNTDYGFNQSIPLYQVVQRGLNSGSTNAPTHFATRVVNGIIYYGVRVRTATNIYNGSGNFLRSAPVGSWVWTMNGVQNMCGASNHHYMSIHGYSDSKTGTMTQFGSTTFVDAGFKTNTPLNYKITTRWWATED